MLHNFETSHLLAKMISSRLIKLHTLHSIALYSRNEKWHQTGLMFTSWKNSGCLLSRICFNLNMSLQIWLRVAARFAKWVFATNRIKYRSQSWIHLVRLVMTSQHCSTENAYQTTELNWLYCMCRLSEKHTSSRKCTCEQMCILIVYCQRYVWDCLSIKHLQNDTAIKSDACAFSKHMATIFPAKPKSITNKVLRSKAAAWQCHGRGSRPGVQDQPMCTTWSQHHSWFIA